MCGCDLGAGGGWCNFDGVGATLCVYDFRGGDGDGEGDGECVGTIIEGDGECVGSMIGFFGFGDVNGG